MESELLKKVQRSKKTFVMIASILVFCAFFYYTFFVSNSTEEEGINAGNMPVVKDSYQEYKDYVSDTNKGIKNLLEGEQLKQIKLYDPVSANAHSEVRENPFVKLF